MSNSTPWCIVLAGGEGTRLLPLTRALHGEDLPKQFARLGGERSLLQTTVSRAHRMSVPERTVVVVAEERERLAREQLHDAGAIDIVAQPKNLGTGPGLLLPLSRVVAKDPHAMVIVMPSDHYVNDDRRFVESVERAVSVARSENAIVLLGAVPDGPETQYGWISSVSHAEGQQGRVLGFVEKPAEARANELFRAGALWNTFIMVGSAARFMALARRNLPSQFALFSVYQRSVGKPWARSVLTSVYERLAPADFSRDVLQESEDQLCAVPLSPCGWSDWGTPERVFRSLRGTPRFDALCERLRTSTNVEQAQGFGLAMAV